MYDELVEEQSAYARQATFDSLTIPVGPRLGGVVVEVEGLTKSVEAADGSGERRLLMEDVSFSVPPGAVVGIVGGNGVGKTTLFNMIMGLDKPDAGYEFFHFSFFIFFFFEEIEGEKKKHAPLFFFPFLFYSHPTTQTSLQNQKPTKK